MCRKFSNVNDIGVLNALDRLDLKISVVGARARNRTAAVGQIRAADVASEMADLSRWWFLNQPAVSILAQANTSAPRVLTLLR